MTEQKKKIWNYTSKCFAKGKIYISGAAVFGAAALLGHGFHTQPNYSPFQ